MSDWLPLAEVASRPGLASRPVAWRGGKPVTRARFLADAAAWRAAFAAQPGARFALYFDDGYEFAAALYGAWHAGKEVYLPGDRQASTLEALLPQVDGCAGDLPGDTVMPQAGAAATWQPLDLRQTRLVVYTSGSGGEPLAISKHLGQLDAEIHTLQATFGGRMDRGQPTPVYATVSHQHIYGLLFYTLWPLAAGRPFVAERILYPEQMAQHLGPGASMLISSPAHLKRLPPALDWTGARAGLVSVFSSGGPLPPESSQAAWELMGHSPTEVFGSSETGGIAWRQRAVHGDDWQTLPGVEWRLDDDLLTVRSPHLPDGQWWQTQDRVKPLGNGGFSLLGRADRVVKIEEKRVSLTAVEAALAGLPEIAEARALVVPATTGDRLAVVAVLTERGRAELQRLGKRGLNERLRAALLETVERIALPRRFRYLRSIPVNAQGKSTQAMLTALFLPVLPQATWEPGDAQSAQACIEVTEQMAVFDGHFDEFPVLPGVAQLDWAIELARARFALPARFLHAEALKFHKPVLPPVRLTLALRWDALAGKLAFSFSSAAGTHSSGRIAFGSGE
ncbi:MAG: acyl-CoA synthetase [Burkholderiales bacterium]|nr:acyl-CoA synthetase [Burkholderiales bacterium]